MCGVGGILSHRPSRFDTLCRHYFFTPTPQVVASFLVLQFRFNAVTDGDLCGFASKFVFLLRAFEKLWARVLAGLPEPEVLCFVTAFTQRYECLCELTLELYYNYLSVYVTIDTVWWLYCA